MSILSGFKKYKKYKKTSEGYQLQSQWTNANSVEFDDGNTAQTNLGAIKGITDSLTATSSNVALSAKAGTNLQTQINELNTGFAITKMQFPLANVTNGAAYVSYNDIFVQYEIGLTFSETVPANRRYKIGTIPDGIPIPTRLAIPMLCGNSCDLISPIAIITIRGRDLEITVNQQVENYYYANGSAMHLLG